MKICSKCGINKVNDDYHKKRKSPDGLQDHCKQCSKEYHKRNREKRLKIAARRALKLAANTSENENTSNQISMKIGTPRYQGVKKTMTFDIPANAMNFNIGVLKNRVVLNWEEL